MASRKSRAQLLAPSFLVVAAVGMGCGQIEGGENGGMGAAGPEPIGCGGSCNPPPSLRDCPVDVPKEGDTCNLGFAYRYPERCEYQRDCGPVVARCTTATWQVDDCSTGDTTCPAKPPEEGAACAKPDLWCEYTDGVCPVVFHCDDERWVDQTGTCNPPELLECPPELPREGERCDDEPFAEYPEQCAYAVVGCGEVTARCDQPSGTWEVAGRCEDTGGAGGAGGAAGGAGGESGG